MKCLYCGKIKCIDGLNKELIMTNCENYGTNSYHVKCIYCKKVVSVYCKRIILITSVCKAPNDYVDF